jgi:hypothetical protein
MLGQSAAMSITVQPPAANTYREALVEFHLLLIASSAVAQAVGRRFKMRFPSRFADTVTGWAFGRSGRR